MPGGIELTRAIEGIDSRRLGEARRPTGPRRSQDASRRLAVDLKGRSSGPFDFTLPLGQIDEEIAAIEAGLERLNTAQSP